MNCLLCNGPCLGHENPWKHVPNVVISGDLIVTERAGYALLECQGKDCETFLLINAKDFGYERNFVCKGCNTNG